MMEPVSQTRMRDCCLWLSLTVVLTGVAAVNVSAEIVFQDFFTPPATNVTNSVPWINVEGTGWQSASAASQPALDGSGHLYNAAAKYWPVCWDDASTRICIRANASAHLPVGPMFILPRFLPFSIVAS